LREEWTERLSESRFGQHILGPKVARPLAAWLEENFGDDDSQASSSAQVVANEAVVAAEPQVELSGQDATAVANATTSTSTATSEATVVPGALAKQAQNNIGGTPTSPKQLLAALKEVGSRVKNHNLVVVAAGIAFWGLLAIPATLFAVVSIAGLVLDPATVKEQVNDNLTNLPDEAKKIIGDQLASVSGGSRGGLITGLLVGLVLALWTSSGAMAKLMGALNTIYDTLETRNFAKLRGTALLLTFGGIIFVSSAIFLLAALPPILSSVDGVGDSAATLFVWLRFPALGLVMVIALGVLYHVGPDRETKYRPLTAGALIAMILWLSLSALFTVYTSTVGSYNETYGSIGGIVILLLWLFITAFVVLLGAEIHAQNEDRA